MLVLSFYMYMHKKCHAAVNFESEFLELHLAWLFDVNMGGQGGIECGAFQVFQMPFQAVSLYKPMSIFVIMGGRVGWHALLRGGGERETYSSGELSGNISSLFDTG